MGVHLHHGKLGFFTAVYRCTIANLRLSAYHDPKTFFVKSVLDIAGNSRQLQLIDCRVTIQENQPSSADLAFLARDLVQLTLPHSDPGDVPVWTRTNGSLLLVMARTKIDRETGTLVGYPYGSIPRLLLYWLTTEVLRMKSCTVKLGSSLHNFMGSVGLSLATGGGKRSNAVRLKDQMRRLFAASISIQSTDMSGPDDSGGMLVARRSRFWWNPEDAAQEDRSNGYVELSQDFYQTLINSPIPVDTRALKALNHSPLALDLYAWSTHKAYSTSLKNKSAFVSYRELQQQLGAQYSELKAFGRKFRTALTLVKNVYPELKVEIETGGVVIYPSQPAIPRKLVG
jgi:Plasmid encoded RepA protein